MNCFGTEKRKDQNRFGMEGMQPSFVPLTRTFHIC
jgi:hypothetical protein